VNSPDVHLCGRAAPDGAPDAGPCDCMGYALDGPEGCTCWEPVYTHAEQAVPRTDAETGTRTVACEDCAFRPDSPERGGDDRYRGSEAGALEAIAAASVFWCHIGLRRQTGWVHPNGAAFDVTTDHYVPPVLAGVPYKADGSPGDRCAGWHARALVLGNPQADR
jgi:hypothetical protein